MRSSYIDLYRQLEGFIGLGLEYNIEESNIQLMPFFRYFNRDTATVPVRVPYFTFGPGPLSL